MKKTICLLLCTALLVAAGAVFASAETIDPDGFVFKVNYVNKTLAGEDTIIATSQDAVAKANLRWAVSVILEKVDGNLYKVAAAPIAGTGADPAITLKAGQIVLGVHSATNQVDDVAEFPNVIAKVNAAALKVGMFITLSGIDLSKEGDVSNGKATCSAEDPRGDSSTGASSESEPASSEAPASSESSAVSASSGPAGSSNTPQTGDRGLIAFALLAVAALAGTAVAFRKRG